MADSDNSAEDAGKSLGPNSSSWRWRGGGGGDLGGIKRKQLTVYTGGLGKRRISWKMELVFLSLWSKPDCDPLRTGTAEQWWGGRAPPPPPHF